MWVMWNLVSVRLEIVWVSVQDRTMVYAKRTIVLDWMHPMVLLADVAKWKLVSVHLEIVLILT
jgi:hypothetical protein